MNGSFSGQVAIVTGGGGGLGREYAVSLAAQGASVVVNDIGCDLAGRTTDDGAAQRVVDEIRERGGTAVADTSDVASADSGDAIVGRALSAWGRVDVVVNNAGISRGGKFSELTPAEFSHVVEVSLGGSIRLIRSAWPHMAEAGYGRIVNVTSHSVFGIGDSSPYIVAKAGTIGLTKALAAEGAALGIVVNAVMPAAYTRMTAQLPEGELHELIRKTFPVLSVTPIVLALAHRDVGVTGEIFHAGGGLFARVALGMAAGIVDRYESGVTILDELSVLSSEGVSVVPASCDEVLGFVFSRLSSEPDRLSTEPDPPMV